MGVILREEFQGFFGKKGVGHVVDYDGRVGFEE